jgi:hypothetical protein
MDNPMRVLAAQQPGRTTGLVLVLLVPVFNRRSRPQSAPVPRKAEGTEPQSQDHCTAPVPVRKSVAEGQWAGAGQRSSSPWKTTGEAKAWPIDGKKRSAMVDANEVAFSLSDDSAASISRSMKTFGIIVPIKGVPSEDSRKYLYYQGTCKAL